MPGGTGLFDPRYPDRNRQQQQPKAAVKAPQKTEWKKVGFSEDAPTLNDDFSNIVILDNIPIIPESKADKLMDFIRTKYFKDKKNETLNKTTIVDMTIPIENKKSLGYAIVEFKTPEDAKIAMQAKEGAPFPSKPTPLVTHLRLFSEFEEIVTCPETYTPPNAADMKQTKNTSNSWLTDDFGRDQFLVRSGDHTQIFWNDPIRRSTEQDQGRELAYWAKAHLEDCRAQGVEAPKIVMETKTGRVKWSPRGSYIATYHSRGIRVWATENFVLACEFPHNGVAEIDFSPCEKYLVTVSAEGKNSLVIVWDIDKVTRDSANRDKAKREFKIQGQPRWPIFQWSHDDSFFSRVEREKYIDVYTTPSFRRLGWTPQTPKTRPIEIKGVVEAQWSPSENVICYWVPESKNQPATVALRSISSSGHAILREKNVYDVRTISMHWQPSGEYLALQLTRKKSKKTLVTNFEVFRMREKDYPIELIDTTHFDVHLVTAEAKSQNDDLPKIDFSWEPRRTHFSIIHGEGSRQAISIYQIKKKKTSLLFSLTDRAADRVYWSPAGNVLILANIAGSSGHLEFYDVKKNETISEQDHFKCTNIEWDPSGRYVLTAATQPFGDSNWQYAAENGYRVWSFQGDLLATVPQDSLFLVKWRPRPPSLLTKPQQAETKKNLHRDFWTKFEDETKKIKAGNMSAEKTERLRKQKEWREFVNMCADTYKNEQDDRERLRLGVLSDDEDDWSLVDKVVQVLVDLKEERLSSEGGGGSSASSSRGSSSLLF